MASSIHQYATVAIVSDVTMLMNKVLCCATVRNRPKCNSRS